MRKRWDSEQNNLTIKSKKIRSNYIHNVDIISILIIITK